MAQDSKFEEMKKLIGVKTKPVEYLVEKGHIRRFAEAIGDANPLWQDEVHARQAPLGGIIAPPTFTRAFLPSDEDESEPRDTSDRVLDAGSEYEFFGPIKIGDRITVTSHIADLYQKQSKSLGTMTFSVKETNFVNQFSQLVVTRRDTSISY